MTITMASAPFLALLEEEVVEKEAGSGTGSGIVEPKVEEDYHKY